MLNKLKLIYTSDKFLKNISIIVFWGSIWGIVEATLGYLLHKINFSFGGCIWFPLAFYFMDKIYRKIGKAQYMLYGALITSAIKLTDLFIEVRIDKVVNPAVSIILEAIALVILYKILEKKHMKVGIMGSGAVNILWRCFYSIYILLMPQYILSISPLRGLDPFLRFMIFESITNTIIITAYVVLRDKLSRIYSKEGIKGNQIKPILSLFMFVFAIFVQLCVG